MASRREFLKIGALAGGGLLFPEMGSVPRLVAAGSRNLARFVDPLPVPPMMPATRPQYYEVAMTQFEQKLHRDLPPTRVWGYNGTYPARTFEARKGTTITVKWINSLPTTHLLQTAIDPTIPDPMTIGRLPDVRTVPHLHGGFTLPQYDGHPEAWFTPGLTQKGPHYITNIYTYYNDQPATTLWYHDHGMGITRLNVYAGLAGFYLLRDEVEDSLNLNPA